MVSFRPRGLDSPPRWRSRALHGPAAIAQEDVVARALLVENRDSKAAFELLAPLKPRARAKSTSTTGWARPRSCRPARARRDRPRARAGAQPRLRQRAPGARPRLPAHGLARPRRAGIHAPARARPNEAGRKVLTDYLDEIARLKARQRLAVFRVCRAGRGTRHQPLQQHARFRGAIEGGFGLAGDRAHGQLDPPPDNYLSANGGFDCSIARARTVRSSPPATCAPRGYRISTPTISSWATSPWDTRRVPAS